MFSKIAGWVPLAISVTALCLLIFAALQQDIRRGANDPQIQIAEDLVQELDSGKKIEEVVPAKNVDLNKSLATFIIIFDEDDHPVASSASLDGRIPTPPKGIFEYVGQHGYEWFTWEPKSGVRVATVVNKYSKGFVLVGRSLREAEKRESWIFTMSAITWAGTIITTFVASLIFTKSNGKR